MAGGPANESTHLLKEVRVGQESEKDDGFAESPASRFQIILANDTLSPDRELYDKYAVTIARAHLFLLSLKQEPAPIINNLYTMLLALNITQKSKKITQFTTNYLPDIWLTFYQEKKSMIGFDDFMRIFFTALPVNDKGWPMPKIVMRQSIPIFVKAQLALKNDFIAPIAGSTLSLASQLWQAIQKAATYYHPLLLASYLKNNERNVTGQVSTNTIMILISALPNLRELSMGEGRAMAAQSPSRTERAAFAARGHREAPSIQWIDLEKGKKLLFALYDHPMLSDFIDNMIQFMNPAELLQLFNWLSPLKPHGEKIALMLFDGMLKKIIFETQSALSALMPNRNDGSQSDIILIFHLLKELQLFNQELTKRTDSLYPDFFKTVYQFFLTEHKENQVDATIAFLRKVACILSQDNVLRIFALFNQGAPRKASLQIAHCFLKMPVEYTQALLTFLTLLTQDTLSLPTDLEFSRFLQQKLAEDSHQLPTNDSFSVGLHQRAFILFNTDHQAPELAPYRTWLNNQAEQFRKTLDTILDTIKDEPLVIPGKSHPLIQLGIRKLLENCLHRGILEETVKNPAYYLANKEEELTSHEMNQIIPLLLDLVFNILFHQAKRDQIGRAIVTTNPEALRSLLFFIGEIKEETKASYKDGLWLCGRPFGLLRRNRPTFAALGFLCFGIFLNVILNEAFQQDKRQSWFTILLAVASNTFMIGFLTSCGIAIKGRYNRQQYADTLRVREPSIRLTPAL